jgi:hypothetical protein
MRFEIFFLHLALRFGGLVFGDERGAVRIVVSVQRGECA